MFMFSNRQFQQLRASRLVVAIFALGMLGFSAAPCHAMSQHHHPGTSHHGSMPAGDCGHCPEAPASLDDGGCAMAAAADCTSIGPAAFERHGAEPQPAAAPPPALPDIDQFVPDTGPVRDVRTRDLPVPHASFQQRYCSYLE